MSQKPNGMRGCLMVAGLLFVALMGFGVIGDLMNPPKPKTPEQIAQETKQAEEVARQKEEQKKAREAEQEQLRQKTEQAKREAEERRVTMAEYQRINNGMTWDEVVAIVGQPTEELSRSELGGIETVMFQWMNEGILAGNMHVMFQNGKVIQKAQFGLK